MALWICASILFSSMTLSFGSDWRRSLSMDLLLPSSSVCFFTLTKASTTLELTYILLPVGHFLGGLPVALGRGGGWEFTAGICYSFISISTYLPGDWEPSLKFVLVLFRDSCPIIFPDIWKDEVFYPIFPVLNRIGELKVWSKFCDRWLGELWVIGKQEVWVALNLFSSSSLIRLLIFFRLG